MATMSQQEFENYVRKGEAVGVPRSQTQAKLQQNGWQIESPTPASSVAMSAAFGPSGNIGGALKGGLDVVKGLVAPVVHTLGAAAMPMFQGVDYLSSVAAGKGAPAPLSPQLQQAKSAMTQQGIHDVPETLLTLGPLGGLKFSKLALPAAGLRFGIDKMEGAPTGEAAMEAAKTYGSTKLLGMGTGPKSMAAIGAGLQTAGTVASGQNPLSPEGLGGIATAGGLGFLGGKSHEKGMNVGMSEEAPGGGKGMVKGQAKSIVSQFSGLRSEGQSAAFEPTTRGLVEGMLSGKTDPAIATNRLHEALTKLSQDVSDTGNEYNFVRESTQVEPVPKDSFQQTLKKYGLKFVPEGKGTKSPILDQYGNNFTKDPSLARTPVLGNMIQNGHLEVDPTGPAARMSPKSIDQLEAFMKMAGGVYAITPEVFKQAKSFLTEAGDFYDPSIPGGGGAIKGLAGEMLKTLNSVRDNATTPDFQAYKALDQKYAPKIRALEEIKGFFEKNPVTGEIRLKDSARGKILNALKGNKQNLVNDLERISPGILREIRAHETYQNIIEENKPGQYVRAGVKGVGIGYAMGGTLGAAVMGIASIFASEPRVIFNLLSKIAKTKEGLGIVPEEVIFKAERGMPLTPVEKAAVRQAAQEASTSPPKSEIQPGAGVVDPSMDNVPLSQIDASTGKAGGEAVKATGMSLTEYEKQAAKEGIKSITPKQ